MTREMCNENFYRGCILFDLNDKGPPTTYITDGKKMKKLTAMWHTLSTGKYKKLLKETKCIHESSKAIIKANKQYMTLETKYSNTDM